MAEQNGTQVTIDKDGRGALAPFTVPLNRGESYLVNGGILKGASVTASKPVQAHIVTGDIGARYETDWFTLYPVEQWDSSYVTPVGSAANGNSCYVFVYNPNTNAITVTYTTRSSSGSFTVATNGIYQYLMPQNSGALFATTNGTRFFAVSTVGALATANNVYDWGFTLLPSSYMTTEAVVGWGPGSGDLTQNGSPVWVTPVEAARVYIDYNGDRLGPLTDPAGNHYDVHHDLAALESKTVYEADKDQTAMRLYTLSGIAISTAWGEDPSVAGAGNPYLDVGTTVLPFPVPVLKKTSVYYADNAPAGISTNDILKYTITVDNKGLLPLGNTVILDHLPETISYEPGTTTWNGSPLADNTGTNSPFPLDESGYTIPIILRGGTSSFTFEVRLLSSGQIINAGFSGQLSVSNEFVVPPPAGAHSNLIEFVDATTNGVTVYTAGDGVYVKLTDPGVNQATTSVETVTVTVRNTTSGDFESVVLRETGPNTGIFVSTNALVSSESGGLGQQDGVLRAAAGNGLSVSFTDPIFGDATSDTATVIAPTLTKVLYLSDPTQSLDRIDPVATGDNSTTQTVLFGLANIAADAFSSLTNVFVSIPATPVFAAGNTTSGSNSTFTLAHTPGVGANRLLLVGVSLRNPANQSVSSVTFAGTNLVFVGAQTNGGNARVEIWRMLAPASGAANVVVTLSAAAQAVVGAATFTGVDPVTPLGAFTSAIGSSTTPGLAITSGVEQLVFDTLALNANDTTLTPGAGQTERWDVPQSVTLSGGCSTKPGTNTVAMNWTVNTGPWALGAVPIRAAGSTLSVPHVTGTGGNRIMMVGLALEDDDANGFGVASIAYQGLPLTRLMRRVSGGALEASTEIWYLLNPPSGSGTVAVAASNMGTTDDEIVVGVSTFDGVSQSTPFGITNSAVGTTSPAQVTVASAAGELVFDAVALDDSRRMTVGANQAARWNRDTRAAAGDGVSGAGSTEPGAASVTMSWTLTAADDWSICAVPLKPATGSGTNWVTFTQAPAFALPFNMASGGVVRVTNYVTVVSGTMPANPAITAILSCGGTPFLTLSNAVYSSAASNLTWSGSLPNSLAALTNQALSLTVTNLQSGVTFRIDYDSSNKASQVRLPTTNVIAVASLGVYDAAYPDGSNLTGAANGAILYVRATVTDPFGAYDINRLALAIDGVGSNADVSVTLSNAQVVASNTYSKTYEYAWNTTAVQGPYTITATAHEGTEGITAAATVPFTLTYLDLGTPSTIEFTTGANGPHTLTYATNEVVCVRVTDLDQNTNAATLDTITVTITNSLTGDWEVRTLTETGPNTGVFTGSVPASATSGGGGSNDLLHAPAGSPLAVFYVDPNDPSDQCSDTATIPSASAGLIVRKTRVQPADGLAVVGETVEFNVEVINSGNTTLSTVTVTDSYPSATFAYVSASPAPSTVAAGLLTWTNVGPLLPGAARLIDVFMTAAGSSALATNRAIGNAGGVTATGTATVIVTQPGVSVVKTLLSPIPGPAAINDLVQFRIVVSNTGNTLLTSVPLQDLFSSLTYAYVSATTAPDVSGPGSLYWKDVTGAGTLAVGAAWTNTITMRAIGGGTPAPNTAMIDAAVDVNGDGPPPVTGTTGVTVSAVSITGGVYDDATTNGVYNAGTDLPLGGVTVKLYTDPNGDGDPGDGTLIDLGITLANGTYEFLNLGTGRYVVVESDLNGYASSGDTGGANDNRIAINAVTATSYPGNNFLDYLPSPASYATIAGTVYNDANANGVADDGGAVLSGVALDLVLDVNSNGVADVGEPVYANTTTGTNGTYLFTSIPAGTYVVRETDPAGFTSTADAAGANDNRIPVTVAAGAASTGRDFFDTWQRQTAAIGDALWLDENGNGLQDAGEAGIPNAVVRLYDTNNVLLASTVSGTDGRYLFANLAAGTYQVRVFTNSLPAGLAANPSYDPQGAMDNAATVTIGVDERLLSVDFGYAWAPTAAITGNTGAGAIGDRLWCDANSDGVQQPGEAGLAGAQVLLYADPDANGVYDTLVASALTDGSGRYAFTNLPAGAYALQVAPANFTGGGALDGYTQTGDPDHFGTTGANDNRTTAAILLGPGDVFVNGDFGYAPPAGQNGSLGGKVWFDANASSNAAPDAGEYRIGGVSVNLALDRNGDGLWTPLGADGLAGTADDEPVTATTKTDTNGVYRFDGLRLTNYVVAVSDTAGVLAGLAPTYDADGTATAGRSAVTLTPGSPSSLAQDFSYTAQGQSSGLGLVGDTLFLDANNDGVAQPGEGLAGVAVTLYGASGAVLGQTVTDPNGHYAFGGLVAGAYELVVSGSGLPPGLTNSVDPDGGAANRSAFTLGVTNALVDLAQDFGYRSSAANTGSVSGTVWTDTNASGVRDVGETAGLAGVTVDLYWDEDGNGVIDPGEPRVGQATTDASGNYAFTGLSVNTGGGNATYLVDVTDLAGVLAGSWHSLGTAGVNDNSQADAYAVTLTPAQPANATADFGYYGAPASLGNLVWADVNADGIQDPGEPGLAGVVVRLTITWPNATTTVMETLTDGSGHYLFANLLLDENFDGAGGGEPVFTISLPTRPGTASPLNQAGEASDSDNPAGEAATAIKGALNDTVDFGFLNAAAYTATIAGSVYDDGGPGVTSAGNTITADDTPQAGVRVSLYLDLNTNGVADPGEQVATDLTDVTGAYAFTNVANGRYLIVETDPAGSTSEFDTQGNATDNTIAITVAGGADSRGNNFLDDGAPVATISGTVYDDGGLGAGGNGAFDGTDAPVPGVLISLYLDLNGNGVADSGELACTTATATNGTYSFPSLPNGDYLVVETNPSGASSVTDADGNGNTADRIGVSLTGTPVTGRNFLDDGTATYAVSGTVYNDVNGDGAFGGDPALGGVRVTLFADLDNNGRVDAGDVALGSAVTGGAGTYGFANVPNGNYLVVETDPAGASSVTDSGEPDVANDNNTIAVTVNNAASAGNDFLDTALGSIGDRVWLDEDADGVQDAGEAGLANVMVVASNTATGATVTNWTDGSGTYRFAGLAPAAYTVTVATNTLAAGLAANPTFDPDATTNHQTTLTLTAGQVVTTADFGYNWAPAASVLGNAGTGAIGDRVWIDADGDGRQDPGEPGFGGVTVRLVNAGPDGLTGTADDATNTTVTAADGSYSFDGLAAGAYVVTVNGGAAPANYTATGDPDGVPDNQTTTPILLAPGDVYVNADFGYRPAAGFGATIGDQVWFDANANGALDGAEYGIAGVTVALIRDTNANGVRDAGEPIVATTLTAADGTYAFTGVPVADGAGTDDYLVQVNDTAGVLAALTPVADSDGTATRNLSVVADLTAAGSLVQDFGYTAAGQTAATGLIGDTVFLDRDADGLPDPGEGLQGVAVELYGDGDTLLGATVTDANGRYTFGGLADGTYVVKVGAGTLPGGGVGLANSVDPDGGIANRSTLTLSHDPLSGPEPVLLGSAGTFAVLAATTVTSTGATLVDGNLGSFPGGAVTGFGPGVVTNGAIYAGGGLAAQAATDLSAAYANAAGRTPTTTLAAGLGGTTLTPGVYDSFTGTFGLTGTLTLDAQGDPNAVFILQAASTFITAADSAVVLVNGAQACNVFWQVGSSATLGVNSLVQGTLLAYASVTLTTGARVDGRALALTGAVTLDANRVTLPPSAGPVDLDQDFGYEAAVPNTITGTLWNDANANGVLGGEAGVYAGVTVTLSGTNGNVIATTVTDAGGNYTFGGLPDGTYRVAVTDAGNVLEGLWHSSGTPGVDNNSQSDPYTVAVSGGATAPADFGYYAGVAALGNRVWLDADDDGIQDQNTNEFGIAGVQLFLFVTYPDGTTNTVAKLSGPGGYYAFGNLLLDENFTASGGAGQPVYVLGAQAHMVEFKTTLVDVGNNVGTNDWLDSDNHAGVTGLVVKGVAGVASAADPAAESAAARYDFGYQWKPTLAVVSAFRAFTRDGAGFVQWETAVELETVGFALERRVGADWVPVTPAPVPARTEEPSPRVYEVPDPGIVAGSTYTWRVVELDLHGRQNVCGPYTVTVDGLALTYETWAATRFTVAQAEDPAVGGRTADPDGDGLTNFEEYLAGTDPLDANSLLRILGMAQTPEGIVLRWASESNRAYALEFSTNISGGYLPWADGILATPPLNTQTCPVRQLPASLFFRVITQGNQAPAPGGP